MTLNNIVLSFMNKRAKRGGDSECLTDRRLRFVSPGIGSFIVCEIKFNSY